MLDPGNAPELARFDDARRVATDPFNNIYVIDAATRRLIRISPDGSRREVGGRSGTVRDPRGVDPTNGLIIVVSDAASGRLHRLNRDLDVMGELGTGSLRAPLATREIGEEDRRGAFGAGGGTPTPEDVVVSASGEVYFIDAAHRRVLKLDALYRFERAIGGYTEGAGALRDPVSLCISPEGLLHVADDGRRSVQVFDSFGSFIREIDLRSGPAISNLRCTSEGLIVIREDRLEFLLDGGSSVVEARLEAAERLRDAVPVADDLLLLTSRRLVRLPAPIVIPVHDGDAPRR